MPSSPVHLGVRAAAAVAALALLAALAPAAPQSDQRIRVDVNLVLVEATVKDRAGRVVDGLTASDFVVHEDGTAQEITHFSRDQVPLAVALVVDLSGSMEPFLRPLRYASATALRALKPEDQVTLFTFTGRVEHVVPLTRDKRAAADEIEFFRAGGATNINQAVWEAARYLREAAPAARRVVVLVSDNVPSARDRASHRDVVEAALAADAAVYSLKVPGRNPRTLGRATRGMSGLVNVPRLAEETGGEVFDVEKEGSLYIAFEALIERLKTRYTLGYYPANRARDGGFRRLEVRLAGDHARQRHQVLAKRGYYAPRASASN
jgi:Ca-activated chloride channel homolog